MKADVPNDAGDLETIISCDQCEETIRVVQHCALTGAPIDDLPEGTIELTEIGLNSAHICPSCRYFGAGAYLAEQQFANGRVGIQISGGLRRVFFYISTIRQYVSETGYDAAESVSNENHRERTKKRMTYAYQGLNEMESIQGCVISELHRLGWPIDEVGLYDRPKDEWPLSHQRPKS